MCGIMGYSGHQQALDILLKGLEQLEYRGYDSSGLTVMDAGSFKRVRAEGPLVHLKNKIQNFPKSSLGIGHTRWATHGPPAEKNAHPHQVGKISIVHNGIIENSEELKKRFPNKYKSQTDTEVIAGVISYFYSKNPDLLQSVVSAIKLLEGSYAFLVLCEDLPQQMIGCRKGPPLALGFGKEGEFFASSDLPVILKYTPQVCVLENHEMFCIQDHKCRFFSSKGQEIKKEIQEITHTGETYDKKNFSHYMLKEIFDQAAVFSKVLENNTHLQTGESFLKDKKLFSQIQKSGRLCIVACGSSYYGALYGKYVIEYLSNIRVEAALASEFQYKPPHLYKNTPVLLISQSGETADTLSCLNKAKENHTFTAALCNVKNSSLDRMADESLFMSAGTETAVASTKAFSASLLNLLLIAGELTEQKKEKDLLWKALRRLPSLTDIVLSQHSKIQNFSKSLKQFKSFLFMGRGPHYPIALEGALKMKELAYIHAEGYPSGEMKHGPLALVDDQVLVVGLAPQDFYYKKNLMSLEEVKARQGQLLTLGEETDSQLKKLSHFHINIPKSHFCLTPLLEVIPLQLLAYHFSLSIGYNPDRPRNLAKSVTVE